MAKAGKELQKTGAELTKYVTLPIAAIGVGAIKTAAEFEQGMANIKAVSGATAEQLDKLSEAAQSDDVINLGFNAITASKGIEELIKAGVSVDEIINGGLKGALSLAAAGEIELADAAEIASTALNAFKDDNLSITQAADALAGAAVASATDVQEMKLALAAVSAVASGVGMTFKDTSTALAVFAGKGLKGSDAGTSLKTMLMNLQPQTKEQKRLFDELGLVASNGTSIFFDQAGKLKSLSEIAQIMQDKFSGMNEAQRLAAMQTIFGTDAIRASNILYKEGAAGIQTMTNEIFKFTAAKIGEEKQNTLLGSLTKLKSTIDNIMIKIGNANTGPLKEFVDKLRQMAQAFLDLSPVIQQQIVIFGAMAAAIGPVVWIIGQLASGISIAIGFVKGIVAAAAAFQAGTVGLGGALTMVFGPAGVVMLVIAALVGLVAGIVHLWKTNEGFRNAVIKIWESIKAAALAVFGYLQEWWNQWGSGVTGLFQEIWNLISGVAINEFNKLKAFWEQWGPLITALFKTYLDYWVANFKFTWDVISNIIGVVLNTITNMLGFWIDVFSGNWEGAWEHIKNIGQGFKDFYDRIIKAATDYWSNLFNAFKNNVLGIFEGIWKGISAQIDKIVGGIKSALAWIDKIKNTVVNAVTGGGSSAVQDQQAYYNSNKSAIDSLAKSKGVDIGVATSMHKAEKHADGGVFTGPTLWGNHLIGEKGPEALIPLDRLNNMLGGNNSDQLINVYIGDELVYSAVNKGLGRKTLAGGLV